MSEFEAAIVMPALNGESTIAQAIRTAIASVGASRRRVVLSVTDDCSTDGTVAVVERIAARNRMPIVISRHDVNRGTGAARNTATAAVSAPVLLFLDQDDEYLPNHVAICLDKLEQRPTIDAIKTRVQLDRPVHDDWVEPIARSLTQNLAVRTYAHRLMGGFLADRDTAIVGCDDVLYNRLLAEFFRVEEVDEPTIRFRHHPGNSFDRQYEAKFSRPLDAAVSTLTAERATSMKMVESHFATRRGEVAMRMMRLRRLGGRRE